MALSIYGIRLQEHQIKKIEKELIDFSKANNIDDLEAYLHLQEGDQILERFFINLITINESYFFRDVTFFTALKSVILPQIIERKKKSLDKSIRIWSAGCSNGQELFSISILLHEMLEDIDKYSLNLYGTDINSDCISNARNGEYTKFSFRTTEPYIIDKYFNMSGADIPLYKLKDKIVKTARFENMNLADITVQPQFWDLIICRNVYIYLTRDIIRYATKNFSYGLQPGGVLALGPSDFISNRYKLKDENLGGYLCYVKEKDNKVLPSEHNSEEKSVTDTYKNTILEMKAKSKDDETTFVETKTYAEKQEEKSVFLGVIRKHLKEKKFTELLSKICEYENKYDSSSIILQYKAEALLGVGDSSGALDYINQGLKVDKVNPKLYFMKGLAEMEHDALDGAEESMRKVIAIESSFLDAYYFLGMIYKIKGDFDMA